jgi:hypothetical protein
VFDGAGRSTLVLINTTRDARTLGIGQFTRNLDPSGAVTVPATERPWSIWAARSRMRRCSAPSLR